MGFWLPDGAGSSIWVLWGVGEVLIWSAEVVVVSVIDLI